MGYGVCKARVEKDATSVLGVVHGEKMTTILSIVINKERSVTDELPPMLSSIASREVRRS